MLRLVRLVSAWGVCKHRLSVSNRGVFSFSSHLFNTKNEIKPNSLLLFNNNNNVVCRGLSQWSKSDAARNHRNNVIRDLKSIEEILAMFEKEGSNYDYQNLVSSLHKISKSSKARGRINVKDQARVTVLERAAFGKINKMRARELSNYIYSLVDLIFIAIEKVKWESINQNLVKKAKNFNAQGLSNTVYALGKLGNRNEEVFKEISRKSKSINLKEFKAQEISNTLYGLALVDLDNKNISKDIFASFSEEILNRDLTGFDEQNLSNIVWSFATLEIKDTKLFELIAKHIVTRDLEEFKPRGISAILYSYALAKLDNEINKSLFDAFSKHIMNGRDLKSFDQKSLKDIVRSFASLEIKDEKLFEFLGKHAEISHLNKFSPREIPNNDVTHRLVLANRNFPKPNPSPKKVLLNDSIKDLKSIEEILTMFEKEGSKYDYQNLVNSLHKISKLGKRLNQINVNDQARVKVLERAAFGKINEMRARELSNYIYTLVDLNFINIKKQTWESINQNLIRKAKYFNAQDISNTVYALVKLRNVNEEVFNAISNKLKLTNLKDFKAQEISNTLYGFALAELDNKHIANEVFVSFSKEILNRDLRSFEEQDKSNIALSFTSLKIVDEKLFEYLGKLIVTRDLKELKNQEISSTEYAKSVASLGLTSASRNIYEINKRITTLNSINEILAMFEKEGSNYDYVNLVNSLHKISKLAKGSDGIKVKDQSRVKVLERASFGKIMKMDARGISNYIYSLADLNFITIAKETWESINQNLIKKAKVFNAQDISNTVYALGKLGNRNDEVFKAISNKIKLTNLKDFNAQNISNTLYGFALADLDNKHIANEVFVSFSKEILNRDLRSFEEQDKSNIALCFTSLKIVDEKLFEYLGKLIVTRDLKELKNQEISSTEYAKSVASLGLTSASRNIYEMNKRITTLKSINEILAMFEKEGSNYDYVNLVNSLHKISKLSKARGLINVNDQSRVKVLERAAFGKIMKMDARGISNYIYSLVDLSFITIEKETWESINQNLISKAKDFNAQGISNTVYTLGKLGNRNDEVFKAISDKIKLTSLKDFKAQEICSTLYGFALADLDTKNISKDVFASFSKEILNRDLTSFQPPALKSILWSFATLEIKDEEMFESFAKHIVTRNLEEFKPQDISHTLYAYALVKLDNKIIKNLFDAFSKHLVEERDLKSFKSQEITNIVWSFATLEIRDVNLFGSFAKHIVTRDLKEFKPKYFSSIVWAYSQSDHKDERLFQTFVDECFKIIGVETFNSQELMNTLYAFSKFNLFPLILPHFEEIIQKLKLDDKPLKLENQHHLVRILAELNHSCGEEGKEIANSCDLNSLITSDHLDSHVKEKRYSNFHKNEASKILSNIWYIKSEKDYEAIKGFFVDIYIPNLNGEKVIISVDGPSHYQNETSKIETHNSKTTKRLLTKAGFKVISLPYFDWDGKTIDKKVDTIKKLLNL